MKEKENELVNAEIVDQENILHLTTPLPNGQTEIYFDFAKLNGYALLACMSQAKKKDKLMTVPALSMEYQAMLPLRPLK